MATIPELEARLETLKAQRDSAVAGVSYDGRSVDGAARGRRRAGPARGGGAGPRGGGGGGGGAGGRRRGAAAARGGGGGGAGAGRGRGAGGGAGETIILLTTKQNDRFILMPIK